MQLITPRRPEPLAATGQNISAVLHDVIGKRNPYVILDSGRADEFMQALWAPGGFLLEFQEAGVTNHFQTIRQNLTLAEVTAAFEGYANGNESAWRAAFLYRQIDPRSPAYLKGVRVGSFVAAWQPVIFSVVIDPHPVSAAGRLRHLTLAEASKADRREAASRTRM